LHRRIPECNIRLGLPKSREKVHRRDWSEGFWDMPVLSQWRPTPRRVGLASVALAVPLLVACSSSSSGGSSTQSQAPTAVCQKVLAVLSDGPDPDADPVGYALSQIAPLGQIHTSDGAVRQRLSDLISADKALVHSNGSDHAAAKAIAKDDALLNKVCPGVAP
jgi:hypothetical protein